jgi:L-threonate 2-dehydrogenase
LAPPSIQETAMSPTIAVVSPGVMGAAVGARLAAGGARVLTCLDGRSSESAARARAAGLTGAGDAELVAADLFLSIVPPGAALATARRFAGARLYVDCNAVSPDTVRVIEAEVAGDFVDVGIIGGPPRDGYGPVFYASGPAAGALTPLKAMGLDVRDLNGPIGAASALKMSYAGFTKGFTALAAAMVLAAGREGAATALRQEMAASQPDMLGWVDRQLATMPPKAYRWVAEMEEIAAFVGDDPEAAAIFQAAARLYDRMARDLAGEGTEVAALAAFRAPGQQDGH